MSGGETETLLHGSAVALGERSAIIIGPSGSGKSDLALRCLFLPNDSPVGQKIELVADDQVVLSLKEMKIFASPPPSLAGRLEVRGLGILEFPFRSNLPVCLILKVCREQKTERLPDPWLFEKHMGCSLPVLKLNPFEPSAPQK
ncbi:MAG: HPr kinase/phosphorylase, partial [Hyphomicrobium sp.]